MNNKVFLSIFLMIFLINMTSAFNFETGGVKIIEPIESNGAIPVNIQDQTSPPLDLFFIQALGAPTNLSNNISIDDRTITIGNTTNFIDGTYVGIFCPEENRFYFAEQQGAPVGNNITLDTPLDFEFHAGDSVQPLTRDMDVDGSTTAQSFIISGAGPSSDVEIDITRIMISLETSGAVDLNKFGDLTKLTNGIVLRKTNSDVRNIWNVKSNGEIANLCYDYDPHLASNPAQGQNGANFRYSFAGQDKHGVAVRVSTGEALELIIQDDLTGLNSFRIIAEGHIVTD